MRNVVRAVLFFAVLPGQAQGSPEEIGSLCKEDSPICKGPNQRGLFQKKSNRKLNSMKEEEQKAAQPLTKEEWAKALGPEIDYRQMTQGQLGDCYFLAALVAIAYKNSHILRDMFIDGAMLEGENPVYTTKWLINGRQQIVATTDKLPLNPKTGKPAFANGKQGAFWPGMLEKAWAKIFGQYMKIDGGAEIEVFKAITQAPIEQVKHENLPTSKEKYWQNLLDWTQKGYVMGAGTKYSRLGLTGGHAYALLEASQHAGSHPQRVKMYNPWGADNYVGKLTNSDFAENLKFNDGIFTMTFDEFLHAFDSAAVAQVRQGAVISDIELSRESQSSVTLEFDMKTDEPFDVQLEWPSARFIDTKCDVADPQFAVAIAKEDSLTDFKLMEKSALGATNARASFSGGIGKYVVFVNIRFPYTKSWLKDFVINVYGPETKLVPSTGYSSPIDLFLKMQGICSSITVPELFNAKYDLDKNTKMLGMPVFRLSEEKSTSLTKQQLEQVKTVPFIFWDLKMQKTTRQGDTTNFQYQGENRWGIAPNEQFGDSTMRYGHQINPQCSASFLQDEVLPEKTVLNLAEFLKSELISDETNLDDEFEGTCGKMVERLPTLGKSSSIVSSGEDPEFPESAASIAPPKKNCGDAAAKPPKFMDCAVFNNWKPVSVLMGKSSTGGEKEKKAPAPTTPTPSKSITVKVGDSDWYEKCVPAVGAKSDMRCKVKSPGKWEVSALDSEEVCVTKEGSYDGWKEKVEVVCT